MQRSTVADGRAPVGIDANVADKALAGDQSCACHTHFSFQLIQADGGTELRIIAATGCLLARLIVGQHLQHIQPGQQCQCRGDHHFDQ